MADTTHPDDSLEFVWRDILELHGAELTDDLKPLLDKMVEAGAITLNGPGDDVAVTDWTIRIALDTDRVVTVPWGDFVLAAISFDEMLGRFSEEMLQRTHLSGEYDNRQIELTVERRVNERFLARLESGSAVMPGALRDTELEIRCEVLAELLDDDNGIWAGALLAKLLGNNDRDFIDSFFERHDVRNHSSLSPFAGLFEPSASR